jgi:hypothetical protein
VPYGSFHSNEGIAPSSRGIGDEAGRKVFTGIGVILAIFLVYAICLIMVPARGGPADPNRFGPDPLAAVPPA